MNITIIGNTGATNLGDDAILGGFVYALQKYTPESRITALSYDPESTKKTFGIESVAYFPFGIRSALRSIRTWKETKKAIQESDLILLGGGGLFTDHPRLYAVLLWTFHAYLVKQYKKSYVVFGQSLGPLETSIGKWCTGWVMKHAKVRMFRDQKSVALLQELYGLSSEQSIDGALLLPTPPKTTRKKTLVFSLRPWDTLTEEKIQALAEVLLPYTQKGYALLFLPMQTIKEGDLPLYTAMKKHLPTLTLAEPKSYQDAMDILASAEGLIGMRLHSLILAYLTGTPFFALSYSTKVEGFLEEIGKKEAFVSLAHFSKEAIEKGVHAMLNGSRDTEEDRQLLEDLRNKGETQLRSLFPA